jgi:hypothetical protein
MRGTFRDPQGTLIGEEDRILREVFPQHAAPVLAWLQSSLAQQWMQQGVLVPTTVLSAEPGQSLHLEHQRIFFPSYAWEWTPGQWIAAGALTIDLCLQAISSGYILKDATPLNILFSGTQPVFVDLPSFEPRDPRSPIWMAYAQFVRTFLLPLAAYRYLGWPLAASLQRRDGYEPADLAPWLSFARRWSSPFRSLVTFPLLLQSRAQQNMAAPAAQQQSEEIAALILQRTLRSARKQLAALAPSARTSRWSNYAETASHYTDAAQQAKQDFVRTALEAARPAHVLDVGANTGVFSRIAASAGAEVVAWDSDVQATELNWQTAVRDKLPILPLVADFARPTPAVGWQNSECSSLLDRARSRFDCVLMLGVLHHLLVSDQIPLPAILDQLADITTRSAILEWIPTTDPQFVSLCRGREPLYAHLTEDYFAQQLAQQFAIRTREQLLNGRTLWLVERQA